MLQSFKSFTDVVAPIETYSSVEVTTNPECGGIMTGDEPKCAKGSGVVSALVLQISTMTILMLLGKP